MGSPGSLFSACFGCKRKQRRKSHDAYRYASRPLEPVQRKVRRTDEDCGSWFSEFDIDGKAEAFIVRQRRRMMNEGHITHSLPLTWKDKRGGKIRRKEDRDVVEALRSSPSSSLPGASTRQ
ncbi:hypothetical protein OPV22_003187 [Ensete ventricosum]|uniref:Uncharacterized protein n=1 Tax=Ensete ventricosum TaxID=4639 RepID=A0AAV8S052_ENSVE|nr:hypothetical protein OPV22_003187 [Ensete ventricosum]